MPDAPIKSQRAQKSDVSFTLFSIMTMIADLVPVRRPGAAKAVQLRSICLDCEDPTLVSQQYVCPTDASHGPWTRGDLIRKAKETDDGLVEIPTTVESDEVTDADEDEPDSDAMTFQIRTASSVDQMTRPDEIGYRIRPKAKKTRPEIYGVLKALATDGRYALIGSLRTRGSTRQYLLTVWNDQLVLQSLVVSADLAPADEVPATAVEPKLVDLALQFAAQECTDYSEEDGRNLKAERLAELVAAGSAVAPTPIAKADTGTQDLLAALEASLAAKAA